MASRDRPYEIIIYNPPIIGPNGNKLISYRWVYDWEEVPNRQGEIKPKRFSNWEAALQNAETGRDIVHLFEVELKDGSTKTVSLETAEKLLGYKEIENKKIGNISIKNLFNLSKSLAQNKQKFDILNEQQNEYLKAKNKFENENYIIEYVENTDEITGFKKTFLEGKPNNFYSVFKLKNNYEFQNNDFYIDKDGSKKYRLSKTPTNNTKERLIDNYVSDRLRKENLKNVSYQLNDLKNKIKRQENKLNVFLSENKQNNTMERFSNVFELDRNKIIVSPDRFQGRLEKFSKDTTEAIVSKGFYDKSGEPIIVWYDKNIDKYIVISGHSRFEATKILYETGKQDNLKTIPVKEFKGTEAEAQDYAILESNRGGTEEGLISDIKAYKRAVERGYNRKNLLTIFKPESKLNKLKDLSYLNENGKFLTQLSQPSNVSFPYLERNASWVGMLRSYLPQLTNAHENEIFDYIYKGSGLKLEKDKLFKIVENKANNLLFNPEEPLNLENVVSSSAYTNPINEQIKDLQSEIDKGQAVINKAIGNIARARQENTPEVLKLIPKFEEQISQEQKAIIEKTEKIQKLRAEIGNLERQPVADLFSQEAPEEKPKKVAMEEKPNELIYIEFLNKDKNFKQDKKYFNTQEEAINWGKKNITNFNVDMLKYENPKKIVMEDKPKTYENTRISKDMRGNWSGETIYKNINGYDWVINTSKTYTGNVISNARAVTVNESNGMRTISYEMFSSPNIELFKEKVSRLTEDKIKEIHYKALALFDYMKENNELPINEVKNEKEGLGIGSIIYFDGPYESAFRDLAIYKIQDVSYGTQYYYIDIKNLKFGVAENVKPASKKFGIGYYYKPDKKKLTENEVANLVAEATEKKAKETVQAQAENVLKETEIESKIEEGKKLVKIPTWAKAVIVADLYVNKSDSQSDYYATGIEKRIYLEFSKTDRANLKEYYEPAKKFEETKEFAKKEFEERNSSGSYTPKYYLGTQSWSGWKVHKVELFTEDKPRKSNYISSYSTTDIDIYIAAAEGRTLFDTKAEKETEAEPIGEILFNLKQFIHSVKGNTIFVAVPVDRLSKEQFSQVLKTAKKYKGYYSNYAKDGAIAGFHFADIDNRAKFVSEYKIEKEDIEKGTEIEQKEHNLSQETSEKIATDHLKENPEYYNKEEKPGENLENGKDTFAGAIPIPVPSPETLEQEEIKGEEYFTPEKVVKKEKHEKALKTVKEGKFKKLTEEEIKVLEQAEKDAIEQAQEEKLTEEQVISMGRYINSLRSARAQQIDSGADSKRRLSPTRENLIRWAKNPGKFDLIGVDTFKATNPTADIKKITKQKLFNLFGIKPKVD